MLLLFKVVSCSYSSQVLSVAEIFPPRISYSYLSPIKDPQRFIWDQKGPWSQCSSECQGSKQTVVGVVFADFLVVALVVIF